MPRFSKDDLRDLIAEVVFSLSSPKEMLLERPAILDEGVYDPNILKAVFTAGGPGSGKSFTTDIIFGVRLDKPSNLDPAIEPTGPWAYPKMFSHASFAGDTGLKYVNSDRFFERGLEKAGVDPSTLADFEAAAPEEYDALINKKIRPASSAALKRARGHYLDSRLGLIVDGTADDIEKIRRRKGRVEEAGYDTMMVFVNTSLEMALRRNASPDRGRELPEKIVTNIWDKVQTNKEELRRIFEDSSGGFVEILNDAGGMPDTDVVRSIKTFVGSPVENEIGRAWIASEMERKGQS